MDKGRALKRGNKFVAAYEQCFPQQYVPYQVFAC